MRTGPRLKVISKNKKSRDQTCDPGLAILRLPQWKEKCKEKKRWEHNIKGWLGVGKHGQWKPEGNKVKNRNLEQLQTSTPGVPLSIAQTMAALTQRRPIWRDNKYALDQTWNWYAPLSFPYFCMSVSHGLETRRQAFMMRCYRNLLNISYRDHNINEEVCRKTQAAIGENDEVMAPRL